MERLECRLSAIASGAFLLSGTTSEMTYTVSGGALNSTRSLTHAR